MTSASDFSVLTPDAVTAAIEKSLGKRLRHFCLPMASYINRVYEVECEDKTRVIAKFYRPGRWSRTALQDEQDFLFELEQAEISVIAPLKLADGATLGNLGDISFALFPKKGGRKLEEPRNDEEWVALGRLIARIHLVGAKKKPRDRITLTPKAYTAKNIEALRQSGFMPQDLTRRFDEITVSIMQVSEPLFTDAELIRIHGDCHRGNLLHAGDGGFLVIDFDDMAVGPPIQDLWMLLPAPLKDSRREMNLLLEGYETFRPFDHRGLQLIEPLRAMRFLHYSAWCARQVHDASFRKHFPEWGSRAYWIKEIADLHEQLEIIRQSLV